MKRQHPEVFVLSRSGLMLSVLLLSLGAIVQPARSHPQSTPLLAQLQPSSGQPQSTGNQSEVDRSLVRMTTLF